MYKQKLEEFFSHYKKEISLNSLISMFKLNKNEIAYLLDNLYELELEGKIIKTENNNYIHISSNYYLLKGEIKKSTKNHFYVNLGHGRIVTIPQKNLMGAKEEDIVFLEVEKGKKHNKQIIGNVKRIIKKSDVKEFNTFYKAILKKDFLKNYYYINLNNKLVYISTNDLNGAFVNDEITIQLINDNYAKVVNIIKRDSKNHVFECRKINEKLELMPINSYFNNFPTLNNNKIEYKEGDKILCEIVDDTHLNFIKKLDDNKTIKGMIDSLLYDFGFRIDFPNSVYNELKNISNKISDEEIKKRVDLRNLLTFTIDGTSAKDLDDAVSLETNEEEYILYVHIADVSHYVKLGSNLFLEACKRGTSIYPGNYVIPQFPNLISNGICSLNPNEDKLTKTFEIHLDKKGDIKDYKIYKSIINSNKKMNYGTVNDILENNILKEDYLNYIPTLIKMNELSKILINKRIDRGQVSLENQEIEFEYDELDNVTEIKKVKRGPAEYLIESFMLITNEIVANFAINLEIPFIYRNHEGPSLDQINKLKNELKELNKYYNKLSSVKNSGMLQQFLLSVFKGITEEEKEYLSKKVFNCMNRAFYSGENIGHYALALLEYATVTSPIRRGTDLINNIILDYVLNGNIEELDTVFDNIECFAKHFTEMQKKSEKFEKYVEGIILNKALTSYYDEQLKGQILFISNSKIFIKVNNNLYGIIPIRNKMYDFDCVHLNGNEYIVGDDILVEIDHIDERSNEIVFKSVKENNKVLVLKREDDNND